MREEAKEESGEFWHRLWASVDLDALQHNAKVLQEKAGDKELMAVVKADGYGHGLSQVVKMLWANGVRWFGVAHPTEGLVVLREAPQAKVYTLGPLLSEEWKTAIRAGMILGISTEEELVSLSQLEGIEGTIRVHLVVDTGMGRMGVMEEEWPRLAEVLGQMPGLQCEGVVTHLPSADEDADYTKDQLERWAAIAAAFPTGERHVGNSAGLLGFDDPSATLVRPGLALYGISPLAELQPLLKPVMSLHARVTLVRRFPKGKGISYGRTFVTPREMTVATVGIGYGDGYPREVSGQGGEVLLKGRRCPILGRVTMDQIMIDVSDLSGVMRGDEVVLFGKQGEGDVLVSEVAGWAKTIPWTVLTGITPRVPRCYFLEGGRRTSLAP